MATFSLDVANEPTYVDIIDIAAGYGIFSTPVDGILPGDQVQGLTLVVTPASGGAAVVSKSIDASLRADGYFEYVTQSEIDAHFTFEAADIAALQGSNSWLYSASASVYRAGQTFTREYQGGSIAVRPTVPLPPMLVNSITVAPATLTRAPGATGQLTATTRDGYGNVITGQPIAWASANPAIAYVDVNGLVTFVTPGTVTITATCQGLTASSAATCSSGGIVPSTGDVLFYNGSLVQWEPHSPIADRIQPGTFGGATAYHFAHGLIVDASGFTVTAGGITVTAGTSAVQALTATTGGFSGGVTAPTFTGALVGNASTATALATPRTINGVAFDGTGNIVVTAAAGTLTGSTLASNVVTSSLTTVGVLASPHMTGAIVDSGGLTVTAGTTAVQAFTATTGGFSGAVTAPSFSGSILGALVNVLTFGTHLTGSSYNNSAPVTLGVDATSANTASAIVARDASGNFTAGTITAATGFTVSAGTASLQAMTATTGTFSSSVTVSSGGVAITGNSTIAGTLGSITTLTATTVNVTTVTATSLGGTLTTAAQANVTSVGILASPHMTAPVVDSGGLTVTAGGLTVSAGSSGLQAVTVTTLHATGVVTIDGAATFGAGVIISSGTLAAQAITGTTASFTSTGSFATTLTVGTGLSVTAGGITVTAGTSALQALTATTGVFASGLTVSAGTSALQAVTATSGTFTGTVSGLDASFGSSTGGHSTTINGQTGVGFATTTYQSSGVTKWFAGRGPSDNSDNYQIYDFAGSRTALSIATSTSVVTIATGLVVTSGTSALQALTATTGSFTSNVTAVANGVHFTAQTTGATNPYFSLMNSSAVNKAFYFWDSINDVLYLNRDGNLSAGLGIASTGAATFYGNLDVVNRVRITTNATFYQGVTSGATAVNVLGVTGNVNAITRVVAATDAGGIDFTNQAQNQQWATLISGVFTLIGATASIATGDPGSGVGVWQLGKRITAAAALDVAHYVETKIDGVVVKLAIVT